MKLNWRIYFWIAVLAGVVGIANAQTSTPPARVYRDRVEPHWFQGNDRLWYRVTLARGESEFVLVDAVKRTRGPAFDQAKLAAALAKASDSKVEAAKLPFQWIRFVADGNSVRFSYKEKSWQCDLGSYEVKSVESESEDRAVETPAEPAARRRARNRPAADATAISSPDGKWEAFVRGHNLYAREVSSKKEKALSYDANPNSSYALNMERERAMEMEYDTSEAAVPLPEVYWSPDSKRLVAMRNQPGTVRRVYLIASSPKDQVQPKLDSYPYLKPGDEVPIKKPHLFEVESGRELAVSDAMFANPWSISDLRWEKDSSSFTFLFNQRGHQVLRVLRVDGATGAVSPVVNEESATFVCYSGKFFNELIEETGELIWMSERDGWNHLYLYDAKAGKVKNQITKGEWVVRGVDRVDREKRQIWFRAGGIVPGQDPYYIHICRVNFDGAGLTVLTEGNGTHTAQFSPDRRFLVDTWSRVNQAPVNELRSASDGKLVAKLEQTDTGELDTNNWKAPEPFVAKGRDGATDIYGLIYRPKKMEAGRKYPIIESIYAGPHDSFVPKAYSATSRFQSLTDKGFIVVQIDGMGTSNRSKKFHDVCWKNLGDSGFPDRILWMKAAAAKHPEMDITRVGVFGGSAGGQSALRAVLAIGDFYKAAAADCGCHDNRMDKIWWNEQWMGWPLGPHYEEQSNVTQAHRLTGKLLLTVGEMDKNVDPASTMQVVDALIKADKDFDLIVFPGAGHGAGGSPYGNRRRTEFFVKHLIEAPQTK